MFWANVVSADSYVTVRIEGQLGNQLFQIATAYAYSLDHNIPLLIPDLVNRSGWNIRSNAERLFLHKIAHHSLPEDSPSLKWHEPHFYFHRIPKAEKIELSGYFQCEKYFIHHRQKILELFEPPVGMKEKILEKYPILSSDKLTVGIQIRDYRPEYPGGDYHPTYGRDYYARAVEHFPLDAIFIVTSNSPQLARECISDLRENVIYLDEGDYIEEFYILVQCKSFIISNSSFGWWAAWLSTEEGKKIVAPRPWFAHPYDDRMTRDILPKHTIVIQSTPIR